MWIKLEEANTLKEKDYTEDSWEKFEKALVAAQEVIKKYRSKWYRNWESIQWFN